MTTFGGKICYWQKNDSSSFWRTLSCDLWVNEERFDLENKLSPDSTWNTSLLMCLKSQLSHWTVKAWLLLHPLSWQCVHAGQQSNLFFRRNTRHFTAPRFFGPRFWTSKLKSVWLVQQTAHKVTLIDWRSGCCIKVITVKTCHQHMNAWLFIL